jgi:hypothetical protein
LALSGTAYISPDYFEHTGPTQTLEGTASKPLGKIEEDIIVSASGTIGRTFFFDASAPPTVTLPSTVAVRAPLNDYTYWNVGITGTYKSKVSVDFRF